MKENIDDIKNEIKEKIKNNPKYINSSGKEFREDILKYGFDNVNRFIVWMQQNGILKNSISNIWIIHVKKDSIL